MRRYVIVLPLAAVMIAAAPVHWRSQASQPSMECPTLDEPLPFENYWVGPSFEELRLAEVVRVCIPGQPYHGSVDYIYENCAEFDVGCGRRVEVQITSTPFTEPDPVNRDMYGMPTSVGGTPGRFSGTQLAIYFPESSVFISGGDDPRAEEHSDLWYRVGGALKKGPNVLADLSAYGVRFPESCSGIDRCEATSVSRPGLSVLQQVVNIAGVLILTMLFGVAPLLILRRRGGRRLFEPDRRSLRVAGILFVIAGVVLYVLVRFSILFLFPGLAAAIAGFLFLGGSLRPRGSYGGGVALGGVSYLFVGAVANALFGGATSLAQFFRAESFFWIVLEWPALPALLLAGYLGR